ncbi:MAG: hypothetical protein ABR576_13850 [Thermoanaerobaculia bacterium]
MNRRLPALLPYAVFLLLAVISWNRWLEPYVDSGRELMVPWRLASGEALYRDVRFYHGPLGPHLAAVLERITERNLPARFALCGLIALLHVEALRRLGRRLLSPGRAGLSVAVIVATAFFLRPGGCHLFPFSLDTAIATAAIAWALWWAGSGSPRTAWLSGAALLAAILSRPEMGLAATAAVLLDRDSARGTRRRAVPLAAVPVGLAAIVYGILSAGTSFATLRQEGWLAVLRPPAEFRRIYAAYAGFDALGLRAAELLLAFVVVLLIGGLLWAAARGAAAAPGRNGGGWVVPAVSLLFLAGALAAWRPPGSLAESLALFPPLIRIVPPLVILAAAARVARRVRRREESGILAGVPDSLLLLAALFSLRVLLVAGYFGPYNAFLLPLPLLVFAAGLFALADRLAPSGPRLPSLLGAALAVFLTFRVVSLRDLFRHPAWSPVDTPAGSVQMLEPVAQTTRMALADLARRVPDSGTLAGFPEAGFLGYALGRRNPLPQEQFFPGHLDAAAERDTIRRLAESPPDAVVYVNVLAVGHRAVVFGADYLTELDRFARERFSPVAAYGPGAGAAARIGDPHFFIQVRIP